MKNHRTHRRIRYRRLSLLATFALVFALASGGAAMAATGYVRVLKAAKQVGPSATANPASYYWQPPGCVFPPARAFNN